MAIMRITQALKLAQQIIVERSFNADNLDELAGLMKDKDAIERIKRYSNHTLLYLNTDEPIPLIWTSSSTTYEKPQNRFIDMLKFLPKITFDSLLFSLTCFQNFRSHDFQQIIHNSKQLQSYGNVYDEILAPSFGYLIYAHQLEQIYAMLTGAGYSEAMTFRKDWNMKRRTTRTMLADIKMVDNISLLDLINKRALDQKHLFCFHALWRSAYLLYNHLLNHT